MSFIFRLFIMLILSAVLTLNSVHSVQAEGTAENGVTAHRGNSGEYPENTLAAFESAILLGADWIELDVLRTKDGYVVVNHDSSTKNVSGVDLHIGNSTLEELQKLDMAAGFRKSNKLTETTCPPCRILLLEDAIRLILKYKKAKVSIQPKNKCVDESIEIIRKLDAVSWVGFNDGNLQYMMRVKELEPTIPVFWDKLNFNPDDIETAKKYGFETLVIYCEQLTPEQVKLVKTSGLKIGVWTVNHPALMKKFLQWGIDRIYTDIPRLLISLKTEKSISFE
ncbi:MAG: glycerophosphodiester phosphodiesterase [Planctomycetaceae bacterium]|jgi:glycerophosphoryl diester phosphodiesterase|nr:glycerophosphodiester phosphodiesterase [Planctomycetaceae bacterium]